MIDFIAPIIAGIATIIAGYLAYRGTSGNDKTDRLAKAAGLYSDYAEKMEQRVKDVEDANKALRDDQKKLSDRLDKSEEETRLYKEEANDYRQLITEVIEWITELLNWEARGYPEPKPHITLSTILSHLTRAMKKSYDSRIGGRNG